ncbi:MAG TPA: AURKAIP1/COX24 domain-containing protein [Syntrophorhabdaceae bacterium]|nr:AURKAIP1/COX24 domain-containing protein [Syntrophorhabdaceae bacterium]NLT22443.1 AURKAIP1/COX24 domain-containing protein [Syntrophorhabdus sp.]HBL23064.1 AURKAIP1/COX24 domain-containing protein [Deltaproteobacteria bacterium]MDD3845117.1 AURKAIP1/COX24 domain-containing protein [Syntrophorhabdaceae bacterium]HOD74715.1 AURKAIP1/COX24 domain-containing protein [Syntrophorhabdaceae bacterium]
MGSVMKWRKKKIRKHKYKKLRRRTRHQRRK